MSFIFSFNVAPPSGFSIDSASGLITIAATAPSFVGTLSVKVESNGLTDIKPIDVELIQPIITPILSSVEVARLTTSEKITAASIEISPVALNSGNRFIFGPYTIPQYGSTLTAGDVGIIWRAETIPTPPPGNMEIVLRPSSSDWCAAGKTYQLSAEIRNSDNWELVPNQGVSWSIVPSQYSSWATVDNTGLITVTNGFLTSSDAEFKVKATADINPAVSKIFTGNAQTGITSIELFPSESIVSAGMEFSIDIELRGTGEGIAVGSSNYQYIYGSITEDYGSDGYVDRVEYFNGSSPIYIAGNQAGTITVTANYNYNAMGISVTNTITVTNTG